MYSTTPPDVRAVALAVYHEARGEPLQCQMLVASVVKNRMKHRKKTAKQVVAEPYQFSWYGKGKKVNEHDAYRQAVVVAETVLAKPSISKYQYFHKGKRGGFRCGEQVFSIAYNPHK